MNRKRRDRSLRYPTWHSLKEKDLTERHVLMAIDLGYNPATLLEAHDSSKEKSSLLLLEWVEDRFFDKHGCYAPMDDSATPESQAEHQAEASLLGDPAQRLHDHLVAQGEDPENFVEDFENQIREIEDQTPVSYGEIFEEDQRHLKRHENFRKAAYQLAKRLSVMPQVEKVVLFGSVALPLWKEVPGSYRFRTRRIKIYHHCNNIDIAVWNTSPDVAPAIRQAHVITVKELLASDIHLSIAQHSFCTHLIDQATSSYHGMVCHYNQCPKHKPACEVKGCGTDKFVQILPWFRLKPERLNSHNSQVMFARAD
jgi:hypothetical protein